MSVVSKFHERHAIGKHRKAVYSRRGPESLESSRSPLRIMIQRAGLAIGLFACLVAPSALPEDFATLKKEKVATTSPNEEFTGTQKWTIPERLRISAEQAYGDLSASAKACDSCIEAWQAIDIAKAYLEEYPIEYLNIRAEYMEDFPWNGEFYPNLFSTDDEWHFGYKIGLRYSGDLDSPFRYNSDLDSQSRTLPPDREPRAGTWRVWYQTGWVEHDELATLVSTGKLPAEALEWGRQPLEEWVLVHAMTGKMEPTWYGRDGIIYYGAIEHKFTNIKKNIRFYSARKAAKERSKLWVKRGSSDQGKVTDEDLKDKRNRAFGTRSAQSDGGETQESASGQYWKRLFIGTCAWGSEDFYDTGNSNCNTLVTDDSGNCLETVSEEHQEYCSSYKGLLDKLDTIADKLGVQIGCANNDGCQADLIVHVESSAEGAEELGAYVTGRGHDSINLHKEGDSCDACAGVLHHEAGHAVFEHEVAKQERARIKDSNLSDDVKQDQIAELAAFDEGFAYIVQDYVGGVAKRPGENSSYESALGRGDIHAAGRHVAQAWRNFAAFLGFFTVNEVQGRQTAFEIFMDAVESWETSQEEVETTADLFDKNDFIDNVKISIDKEIEELFEGIEISEAAKQAIGIFFKRRLDDAFTAATITPRDPTQPPDSGEGGGIYEPLPGDFELPDIPGGWCRLEDSKPGPDDAPTVITVFVPCRGLWGWN